ncbi:MAG: TrmH family RNA methyltransferase [Bacteroidetes bacterium]|nr:MAG: TrmH family RNA methyltransferase [Bacteroidota bacterium]
MKEKQRDFRSERADVRAHLEYIRTHRHPVSLLLDEVHDVRNVGAIFRLADAARLRKVYFYKPPEWKLESQKALRISRHTIPYVPYEFLPDLAAVENLKKDHRLVALEWTNKSRPYPGFEPAGEVVLILGNEQRGISDELLEVAHESVHIPMFGMKTSMNVACAAGIVAYDFLRRMVPFGSD